MRRKPYLVTVQGTEVWIRILKCDLDALKDAGHKLSFDEREEGIYVEVEHNG